MDSRIEPLEMIGLRVGDAKIMRMPGGRVTARRAGGCMLGAHLLGVRRILVVAHTAAPWPAARTTTITAALPRPTVVDV